MDDLEIPVLNDGDILVEMRVCGLCGSDIEKIHGEYNVSSIIGHEASGIIKKIGGKIDGLDVGDRVFPHHHVACRSCHYCTSGSETMCPSYRSYHYDPGGFAEFFRVPSWNVERGGVLKLPDSISFEDASFIEPTACCIRAIERARVEPDDSLLVIGAGPIGITFLELAPHFGISEISASDVSHVRLQHALRHGASNVYNPSEYDVPSCISAETDGEGVDVAVIASGNPKAIVQGLKSIRRGGKVILFGIPIVGSSLEYDMSTLVNNELSIIPSNAATERETSIALDYIAGGKIDVTSMITHRYPIDKFEDSVAMAVRGEALKVLITN